MRLSATGICSNAIRYLVVAILLLGVLATPLAAQESARTSSELTVTVTDDGEIDSQHVRQEMPLEMADAMELMAEMEGYDNFAAYTAETIVEADDGVGDYESADTREEDDAYVVELTLVDIDADELDDVDVAMPDDETVDFEMQTGSGPAYGADAVEGSAVGNGDYAVTVEMPGEITDSNALEEDGSVATWRLHEETPDALTAESGTDGGSGIDGLAGFGPLVAIGSLLSATLLVARHRS